ncbi:MAG: class I SAM-dependent methyltransferase [Undibacterium sp.]|uniref:class I SAM-dependent methyltransferase n=1 Tax=Undibacterium sp. TaxID=1914977 RepID=UPI002718EC70|nr:class I SAM-dependent methyltransferase [Undibacterium sp.]MDO8652464.1 class I SAM-dependent methyltransferase [Undibacterium sp.]
MECPLCSFDARLEQSIDAQVICSLWEKSGVNVSNLFKSNYISKYDCRHCGLGFYSPACPGDDAFYGKLAEWDWYYKHPGKSEYKFTSDLISPGSNIIDVGCGIGEFSTHLPPDVIFLGVELSSKSVDIAISLKRNVHQIDITKAPAHFKNHFDVVTCFQVLEHVVEIHSFFSALVSLCKPGGVVVIAVPNNDGFVGAAVNNIFNMPPHHILLWNKQSLFYLAECHNLVVSDYVEEALSQVHRYWGFSVLVNRFFTRIMRISPKVVDISFRGKILSKLSAILARPLSRFFPQLLLSGHSSILVLRKAVDEKL